MYDIGDSVVLAVSIHDPAGALANAAAVVLTITLPDGTTVTPAVTTPPAVTGQYTVTYVPAQAGRYTVRWVATTPNDAHADVFNVRAAGSRALVALDETKLHLNIAASNTTNDVELRDHIEAVTDVIENIIGAVNRRTVVETRSGRGRPSLVLYEYPILSITSVLEHGQVVAPTGYSLDVESSILTRVSGYQDLYWLEGRNNIVITEVIGRVAINAAIQEAAKELARVNFRPQMGGTYTPFAGGVGDEFGPPTSGERRLGFYVPNRVMQMLTGSERPDGMA